MYAGHRDRYYGDPDFVDVPVEGLLANGLPRRARQADRRGGRPAAWTRRNPKGAGARAR